MLMRLKTLIHASPLLPKNQGIQLGVDPADYAVVLDELTVSRKQTLKTRQRLAAKVFRHTSSYDALIAEFTKQPEKQNLKNPPSLMI